MASCCCTSLGYFVDYWSRPTTTASADHTSIIGSVVEAVGGDRRHVTVVGSRLPLQQPLAATRLAATWRAGHSKRAEGRVPGWAPPAIVALARFESSVADQASTLGTSTKIGGISHPNRSLGT